MHNQKKAEQLEVKILFLLTAFFIFNVTSQSQTVLPLNNIKEVERLKETNKGKVVLVNFWATWCVPCVEEFPELVKLYKEYKKEDFKIIFISVDPVEDVQTRVQPFLKKKKADFTSYYSNFEKVEELINYFDKDWGGGIPATYIFSRDGKLTSSLQGSRSYSEFESEIKKYLE